MLTLQEVFEECANLLLNQNKKAESNGSCYYFMDTVDDDGETLCLMCAASPMLKREKVYGSWFNNATFEEICSLRPEALRDDVRESFFNEEKEEVSEVFLDMMEAIQNCHDEHPPYTWLIQLQQIAEKYNLNLYFLKQRSED